MKRKHNTIQRFRKDPFWLLLIIFLYSFGLATGKEHYNREDRPNIILILADDLGYADLSMNGSDLYETPNIDKLASQSVIFSRAYASHPTCVPSRLAIQTGKYPARLNCVNHSFNGIPPETITISERLKTMGYKTCHIGKWHLGNLGHSPINQGYDISIATNKAGMPATYFYPFKKSAKSIFDVPDLEKSNSEDFLTDKLTDKAIDFIQQNRDGPFFINLCFYAVHTPIEAKDVKVKKYQGKLKDGMLHTNPEYAGLVEHLDDNVGRILEAIQKTGIADNTIVLFFSDNGGLLDVTSNFPFRDGKGSLYEGGIREPLFIKWPGVTKGGTVCHAPVIGHDLYPTILTMAGIKKMDSIDGVDITPLLINPKRKLKRNELHWLYFPISTHHFANPNRKPGGAIIKDNWKLIELMETPQGLKHHFELYNLKTDPGEKFDISRENPGIVKRLKNEMGQWRKSINAPEYTPAMYNK